MLNVSGATRVLVATTPVDLRGSFNRLYSLVVEQLKEDPLSGHLFVFTNRRRHLHPEPARRAGNEILPAKLRRAHGGQDGLDTGGGQQQRR